MEPILINAIQRLNESAVKLAKQQADFSMNLTKLFLAIQANETIRYASMEMGFETELRIVTELCEQAQNLDIEEINTLTAIGNEVDAIVRMIINDDNKNRI